MKLYEYEGKQIRVTFADGETLEGMADYYTSALDNPEGKESLAIGNTMFFEDEVAEIQEVT